MDSTLEKGLLGRLAEADFLHKHETNLQARAGICGNWRVKIANRLVGVF